MKNRTILIAGGLLLSVVVISMIVRGASKAPAAAPQMPPSEVGVMTVALEIVPMVTELPGRVDAIRMAQVRARATGILLKRLYKEGSEVNEGDILFEIDPAPLKAADDSAKATLAQAKSRFNRYKELIKVKAISKQDYDDASAAFLQAKAAAEMAALNLGYARVTAPISGHIGAAKVTEGALVSQTEATQLALIQQLDPIYVDLTQSSTEVLRLKKALDEGRLQSVEPGEAKVTLVLDDGTTYPGEGKLLFSDTTVDPTTGMVTLRAEFPNPDHTLLPGMFARARLEQAVDNKAITVSQRGIVLGPNGTATAMVVNAEDKVEARPVKVSTAIGDKWVVTQGLKEGDRVIVEGLQKARPGASVKAVPFVK